MNTDALTTRVIRRQPRVTQEELASRATGYLSALALSALDEVVRLRAEVVRLGDTEERDLKRPK